MAWVPDSSEAGYLGPKTTPAPLSDDAWEDFLHDLIAGVTGLANDRVLPAWQENPPNWPLRTTDWVSFRITSQTTDEFPAVVHDGTGDGQDLYQAHETSDTTCIVYGPNAGRFAGLLRDGLKVWQNQAPLRAIGAGLVEVGRFTSAPELLNSVWLNRIDLTFAVRRPIRRNFPVLNLVRASGTVSSDSDADSQFDTGEPLP